MCNAATTALPQVVQRACLSLSLANRATGLGSGRFVVGMECQDPPTPASSVATATPADVQWGLTNADGVVDLSAGPGRAGGWSLKEIRDKLGTAFETSVRKHGGPMQFLTSRYFHQSERVKYAKRLWSTFPPLGNMPPTLLDTSDHLPSSTLSSSSLGQRNEIIFHIAQLDFSRLATLRQPPALKPSLQLADEILTSGFVTNGDPIMVNLLVDTSSAVPGPWPVEQGNSRAFIFGFVKGANRLCTLHALVTLCFDDDIIIEQAGVWGVVLLTGPWLGTGGWQLAPVLACQVPMMLCRQTGQVYCIGCFALTRLNLC